MLLEELLHSNHSPHTCKENRLRCNECPTSSHSACCGSRISVRGLVACIFLPLIVFPGSLPEAFMLAWDCERKDSVLTSDAGGFGSLTEARGGRLFSWDCYGLTTIKMILYLYCTSHDSWNVVHLGCGYPPNSRSSCSTILPSKSLIPRLPCIYSSCPMRVEKFFCLVCYVGIEHESPSPMMSSPGSTGSNLKSTSSPHH